MTSPSKPAAPAGKAWRAATRLTAKDKTLLADVGQTCERVPDTSLPWLIEQELVRPLDCTCPGVPRLQADDCPVDHAAVRAAHVGATAAHDAQGKG